MCFLLSLVAVTNDIDLDVLKSKDFGVGSLYGPRSEILLLGLGVD